MFGDLDWPWNESCAFVNISINCQLFSNFRFIVRHICYYLVSLNIIICVSLFLYLYLSLSSSPLLSLSLYLSCCLSLSHFFPRNSDCYFSGISGCRANVSNPEVLQRSGLSAIGDILRHRRLSLFGHIARLDPGVPVHDALRLMVDIYEGRKLMAS